MLKPPKPNSTGEHCDVVHLGRTIRILRERAGLTQQSAADALGVTNVHLCNLENNKATPSTALIKRCRELWGTDPYVLAWCLFGDTKRLPEALQAPATALRRSWRSELDLPPE